jgi:mRNA interferase MazF
VVIQQGEVYWVALPTPAGSEPGYRHPGVVVQNSLFCASRVHTVIICLLTSNERRADDPGNVVLRAGEGGLPQESVANVSQVFTVDRLQLGERIGRLSRERVRKILDGIYLWLEPREPV